MKHLPSASRSFMFRFTFCILGCTTVCFIRGNCKLPPFLWYREKVTSSWLPSDGLHLGPPFLQSRQFLGYGHFSGLPEAMPERIQTVDRQTEKHKGFTWAFSIGNLMEDTPSAISHLIMADESFHRGHRSTPCGFSYFHLPNLDSEGESCL